MSPIHQFHITEKTLRSLLMHGLLDPADYADTEALLVALRTLVRLEDARRIDEVTTRGVAQ